MMYSLTVVRNALKSVLVLLIMLGFGTTALAQNCQEYLSAYPQVLTPYQETPYSTALAKAGDRVFLCNTVGVVIYDVSNPVQPVPTDTLDISGAASGIVVQGDYAFVASTTTEASNTSGLFVFDITPGSTPFLVSSMTFPYGINDVEISGPLAFLPGRESGIFIVDISDPAQPVQTGMLDTPDLSINLSLSGSFAYIADRNGGIIVADVSDPNNPAVVDSLSLAGNAFSVHVHDNLLFAGDYENNLYTLDITDPAHPTIIGTLPLLGLADDFVVHDGDLWISAGSAGLTQIDMTHPENLAIKDIVEAPASVRDFIISEHIGFVANSQYGLLVMDLSFQLPDFTLAWERTPGTYAGIGIAGHYAYIPYPDGILVVNVADPLHPETTSLLDLPGVYREIHVFGQTAYVGFRNDGVQGIQVIDVSDPGNPLLGLTIPVAGIVSEMTISGNLLLTHDPLVFDLSDPAYPQLVGSGNFLNGFGWAAGPGFAVSGTFGMGVEVVDLTDPSNPFVAGSCNFPGLITDIELEGDWAFVLTQYEPNEPNGIFVVDISDKTNPRILRFHELSGFPDSITSDGDILYVATGLDGIMAWDISDPLNMVNLGSSFVGGLPRQVAVFGDHLIMTTFSKALTTSLKPCLPQPVPVPVLATQLVLTAAPNPFNPNTTISFSLSATQKTRMDVFDVRGRLIRHLVNTTLGPGVHTYEWNGRDESGVGAASGIYFAKLTTGQEVTVKKMALLK